MTPIPTWTIEAWCATQQPLDWKSATSLLSPPSVAFLERLNLPSKHPFCELAVEDYEIPGVPGQGPLLSNDHLETLYDIVVTVFAMGAPSLAAMAELWLRLFAFFLAPLGIAHLLYQELQTPRHTHNNNNKNAHQPPHQSFVSWHSVTCLLTTTSAAILWTDTLYVLEYGPSYGGTLFALAMLLSWKSTSQMHRTRLALASILVVTAMLLYDHDSHQLTFGHPHDTVHIKEGIYYDGMYVTSTSSTITTTMVSSIMHLCAFANSPWFIPRVFSYFPPFFITKL